MLGNFQHNPDRVPRDPSQRRTNDRYFKSAIREIRNHPREGLIHSFLAAELEGDRFTEDEVIANTIITMVGGLERR